MKSLVLIVVAEETSREALIQAARSQACRFVLAATVPMGLAQLGSRAPDLVFCDVGAAESGRTLKLLHHGGDGPRRARIVLLIPTDIRPELLKSLRPWVHDYLGTPVLRETATARIYNCLRQRDLESAARRDRGRLETWLAGAEQSLRFFQPFGADRIALRADLTVRIFTWFAEAEGPAALLFCSPAAEGLLSCELFLRSGPTDGSAGSFRIAEAAVFFRMRHGDSPVVANYSDRGGSLAAFQMLFPPELLQEAGMIRNFIGLPHDDGFLLGINFPRTVAPLDGLLFKGLCLPAHFLGAAACRLEEISDSFFSMMRGLALATDSVNDGGAHINRMNDYALCLARQMGLSERFVRTIAFSAQLHDVGKIGIHPDLLEKPVRLTTHEFEIIKKHPRIGAGMLGDAPLLRIAKNIALTHHECWDGSGYPSGLTGEAIPLEGAIVKLADVYDALRTMHSYKASYSHEDACRFILDGGGDARHDIRPTHFHPAVLRAFRSLAGRFEEIYVAA